MFHVEQFKKSEMDVEQWKSKMFHVEQYDADGTLCSKICGQPLILVS